MPRYGRFKHLQESGVVNNWPTLLRWIDKQGFPAGIKLGPATTVWDLDAVDAWVKSRAKNRVPSEAA
jgi:hypothetical protein